MIVISKIVYNKQYRILLRVDYLPDLIACLRTLPDIHYSKTFKGWHLPYSKDAWLSFVQLNLPYTIDHPGTTGCAKPISDNAGKTVADVPENCTPQAADTPAVSILYRHPHFFVKGLSSHHIPGIKSLSGSYWNQRYHNWVVPARSESLAFFLTCGIISDGQHQNWSQHLLSVLEPPQCILYCSPEYPHNILLQLKGHNLDVDFLKKLPQRHYDIDRKFWILPHHEEIIARISDHYRSNGTVVINRIKIQSLRKKRSTYQELKNYLLSKTPDYVQYATTPYINTLITQGYSISTIREYYGRFKKFTSDIAPIRCDEANEDTVNTFLCKLSESNATETLINSYINAIKFYYEKVIFHPEIKLERVKRPRKGHYLPKILSVRQVDAMLRATQNLKHTALLYALYGHGVRLNELLSIRIDDLLWDRNQIFVHQGKGNKDRYVPMSQEFKSLMQLYIHEYKPQYWIFEGQDQKSQYSERSVQQMVKNAAKKAGISIKVSPHMLRHSYATHLVDMGTQLPYVKELLGHKDIKTTMIYTHVTTASIENVVSPLDRLRNN
jgi:integrase/recombinase XerD